MYLPLHASSPSHKLGNNYNIPLDSLNTIPTWQQYIIIFWFKPKLYARTYIDDTMILLWIQKLWFMIFFSYRFNHGCIWISCHIVLGIESLSIFRPTGGGSVHHGMQLRQTIILYRIVVRILTHPLDRMQFIRTLQIMFVFWHAIYYSDAPLIAVPMEL